MPKKTRKMKQRAALRRETLGAPEVNAPEMENAAMQAAPRFSPSRVVSSAVSYDYSHIYRDLKRIAMFAAFFFAVLIVLSFVIK
ncbi:hypothetical protein ANRL3_00608 [Anaerolineae bacterium]|nr:hypothetical protein ANRL3_00608 [Anaerolineae bacterium]